MNNTFEHTNTAGCKPRPAFSRTWPRRSPRSSSAQQIGQATTAELDDLVASNGTTGGNETATNRNQTHFLHFSAGFSIELRVTGNSFGLATKANLYLVKHENDAFVQHPATGQWMRDHIPNLLDAYRDALFHIIDVVRSNNLQGKAVVLHAIRKYLLLLFLPFLRSFRAAMSVP